MNNCKKKSIWNYSFSLRGKYILDDCKVKRDSYFNADNATNRKSLYWQPVLTAKVCNPFGSPNSFSKPEAHECTLQLAVLSQDSVLPCWNKE